MSFRELKEQTGWYPHELVGMYAGNLEPREYEPYIESGHLTRSYDGVGALLGLSTLREGPKMSDCTVCNGETVVDSGGVTPWGAGIDVKCGHCNGTGKEPK